MKESKRSLANRKSHVPTNPVIPFIEGDGTGPENWKARMSPLFDYTFWFYGTVSSMRIERAILLPMTADYTTK